MICFGFVTEPGVLDPRITTKALVKSAETREGEVPLYLLILLNHSLLQNQQQQRQQQKHAVVIIHS